ncbi:MAG: hypothetical protein IJP88_09615, partial [Synergistaceae bacterium]|nr:hypothetical protein [Synergistaceae bacterium]
IKAYEASGNEIEITSNARGVLTFASQPAKIVYDYDVGYNGTKMDVTISDNTNKSGSSSDSDSGSSSGSKKTGGGSGGGCNSGFNFSFSLLFILALAGVKSCVKYF